MRLKIALIALAALGGVALTSNVATAMPNGIPQANQIADQTSNVEQARLVCDRWGRCWRRPGWRGAFAFAPRPWHRGWRRGWRHF
jgi:hypothetical protein